MKLGSNDIGSVYIGSTAVTKIYIGSTEVWSAVDADAQAFFDRVTTAGGTLSTTEKNAVNTLVKQMKTDGIWTKMKAIYPFVGGTATSHKFNLKDPRDLDAAFRLYFSSGWSHSSNGATPSGNGAYANTFCQGTEFSQNSNHLSLYSRTDINEAGVDMGYYTRDSAHYMAYKYASEIYPTIMCDELSGGTSPYTTTLGHIVGNRNNATQSIFYQDGTKLGTFSRNSTAPQNLNIFIGAYNHINATNTNSSTKEFAFASLGDGLTDAEVSKFSTAIDTFQTTLGRQV